MLGGWRWRGRGQSGGGALNPGWGCWGCWGGHPDGDPYGYLNAELKTGMLGVWTNELASLLSV